MAAILKAAWRTYNIIFEEYAVFYSDEEKFLMSSPWLVVTIAAFYVYFSTTLGPQLMKNRPPFNVEKIINIYNLFQIGYCFYIIKFIHDPVDTHGFPWFNFNIIYEDTPIGRHAYTGSHIYFVMKLVDLLDTVFFVLRKKNNQITFLHVYHHVIMLLASWVIAKFFPGGHAVFLGYINCYVHAVMYLYYFITSMWPEYKKKIWWKKYITAIQMIQFALTMLHSLPLFFMKEVKYPRLLGGLLFTQNMFMFMLFADFYYKTYVKKK